MLNTRENNNHEAVGTDVRANESDEGFITQTSRRRRRKRVVVTGRKAGTSLRAVATSRKIRVFVSRLEPDVTPSVLKQFITDMIHDESVVETLTTRHPNYSSFLVSCDISHEDTILSADEWPEGILVRRFFGQGPPREDRAAAAASMD